MRRDIPDLSGPPRPLAYATVVAEALADLEAIEQAERELETELEERDRRRLERDAPRDRRWAPPWRCDRCHKYVSSARSVCTCGHVGASNDEGHRTSYQRAHARRQARRRSR